MDTAANMDINPVMLNLFQETENSVNELTMLW